MIRALFGVLLITAGIARADHLTIVSPHWEGIRYEMAGAFAEEYEAQTGREVTFTWLDMGGTSEILRGLRSQFKSSPESVGIDLLFGGGVDPFVSLKQDGLLQSAGLSLEELPDTAREVAGVPLHDIDGMFYAPVMSVFGIVCNREVLKRLGVEEPKSWEDLGRPEFRGWVGTSDPRRSGSTHAAYEIMLQAYGWDKGWRVIQGLGGNARTFVTNSIQVSKDVSNGEVACGLAIDSQAWSQIRTYGRERISFIVPEGLTVAGGDSVALLKGAPEPVAARAFVKFLLSERAQKLWLLPKGAPGGPKQYELARLSVMPKLYGSNGASSVTVNPFELRSAIRYDSALGTARWGLLNDLLGVFVVDPHARSGREPFTGAPISEPESVRLAALKLSPYEHAELIHSWEMRLYSADSSELLTKGIPSIALLAIFAMAALRRRRS